MIKATANDKFLKRDLAAASTLEDVVKVMLLHAADVDGNMEVISYMLTSSPHSVIAFADDPFVHSSAAQGDAVAIAYIPLTAHAARVLASAVNVALKSGKAIVRWRETGRKKRLKVEIELA